MLIKLNEHFINTDKIVFFEILGEYIHITYEGNIKSHYELNKMHLEQLLNGFNKDGFLSNEVLEFYDKQYGAKLDD